MAAHEVLVRVAGHVQRAAAKRPALGAIQGALVAVAAPPVAHPLEVALVALREVEHAGGSREQPREVHPHRVAGVVGGGARLQHAAQVVDRGERVVLLAQCRVRRGELARALVHAHLELVVAPLHVARAAALAADLRFVDRHDREPDHHPGEHADHDREASRIGQPLPLGREVRRAGEEVHRGHRRVVHA